jgi:copper homeostasis protein (lipoprotein)
MQPLKPLFKLKLTLLFFSLLLLASGSVWAISDREAQEQYLRAREMNSHKPGHAAHEAPTVDKSQEFHGVFYGYLPCKDCDGIKATLSLKQYNNYLLVTQPAKESSREFYEKGKYTWDDKTQTVVLTPRKEGSIRHYRIENEGTLIQLSEDGMPIQGDKDDFTLRRGDTVNSRQVHIH